MSGWLATATPAAEGSLVPNILARSSLFAARTGRGSSKVVISKPTHIPCYLQAESITQLSGVVLTQDHLDVWLWLVKRSYTSAIAAGQHAVVVAFCLRELLRGIGRSAGGSDLEWLRARLVDLQAATYRITYGSAQSITALLHKFSGQRTGAGQYEAILDVELRDLFLRGYSRINMTERLSLDGDTAAHCLAQWLHAFYSTHASPIPVAITRIQDLCGRGSMDPSKFKAELKKAVSLIDNHISTWKCTIKSTHLYVSRGSKSARKGDASAVGAKEKAPAQPTAKKPASAVLSPSSTVEELEAYGIERLEQLSEAELAKIFTPPDLSRVPHRSLGMSRIRFLVGLRHDDI